MNQNQRRNYDQYLERYCEVEARQLQAALSGGALVLPAGRTLASIPLCQERELIGGCLDALCAAAEQQPAIVIFIVNNRASASDSVKENNQQTLAYLRSRLDYAKAVADEEADPEISAGAVTPELFMLLVDRATEGRELPEQQGVGMARKIGCDLASVIVAETVTKDAFIRNTDGDARVGSDFFAPIDGKLSAALYPFCHEAKGDGVDAVLQYEMYLHYYVRAMRFAGSYYAFHTVGSTIACNADSYISCRGFPKRDAGEDFYLLNKLAKVGPVEELQREPITLVARDSDRVPFGTGAACRRIEGLVLEGGAYKVYHPDCFHLLKIWLQSVAGILEDDRAHASDTKAANGWDSFVSAATRSFPTLSAANLQALNTGLSLAEGLSGVLEKSPRYAVRMQHARIWFDGFRTMRFLNLAREHCFGEVPVTSVATLFS